MKYSDSIVKQDSSETPMLFHKQLFEKYYARLCDFARRIVDDADAAEDIVQDVFVAFIERSRVSPVDDLALPAYLYQSVRNACLNVLRKNKVIERHELNHSFPTIEDEHALTSIVHSEIVGEIHGALKKLPEGCRLVIRLGYFDGLNNPQIASEMNISVNTVKSQKQRALFLLRKELVPGA